MLISPVVKLSVIATLLLTLALSGCSPDGDDTVEAAPEEQPAETGLAAPSEAIAIHEEGLREQIEDPRPEIRIRAEARLGLLYSGQGRWEEAKPLIRRAIDDYEVLRPYLQLKLAEILAATEQFTAAAAIVEKVISENSGSSAETTATIQLPRYYVLAGDVDAAKRAAARLASVPLNEFTEKAVIETADILARNGAYSNAQAIRQRIVLDYPSSRYIEKLYDQLVEQKGARSDLMTLPFDEGVDLADGLAGSNRFPEALDYIHRLRERFPDENSTEQLRWIEARSLFSSRRYSDLQKLSLPESNRRHVDLERLKGHAAWRLDRDRDFVRRMEHIIEEHPDSDQVTVAQVLLGKYWLTDGDDPDRAIEYLTTAIGRGEPGPGGENLWILIWTLISGERHDEALAKIDEYLEHYPDDTYTTNALFWKGKLNRDRGRKTKGEEAWDRLITDFPYVYYSYRVREIQGLPLPPDEVVSGYRFPEELGEDQSEVRGELKLAAELELIGLEGEATRVYRQAVGTNPENQLLAFGLASHYERSGELLEAIIVLSNSFRDLIRHGGTGIPDRFWEILYPRRWWGEIVEAAKVADVDPFLMAGIIRQESGWDPLIVSSAGAAGLMQIMPRGASHLGRAAGFERTLGRDDLFDPEINIRLGAAEIVDKMNAMDGHETLAIAAYNAGQGTVRRWLRSTPADDIDFFIDAIPYTETRRYVMAVTRNRMEYRRIYGDQ